MAKTLIIASSYPRHDGDYAVPWMREAIRHLVSAGNEIQVLAPSFRGLKDHTIDGVRVRRFRYAPRNLEVLTHEEGAPNKINRPWMQALAVPYLVAGVRAARRIAKQESFDVVHCHWPFPHAPMAQAAANACGAAVVANCHGAELAIGRRKWWVARALQRALTSADALAANSSHTAETMQKLSGRTATVLPYGSTATATGERPSTANNPPVILLTGRLIQRKGVEYLVEAVPHILAHKQVRVVITGDGDRTPHIRQKIERLGLSAVIEMAGFVTQERLAELYRTSDVYVLPAVYDDRGDTEGLGVTTIEAFANLVPVVASAVGGILDVVEDRVTGLLVPEKDPPALAEAILEMLDDPELAQRLALAARDRAKQRFDWGRITQETVAVWEEAIRNRNSGRAREPASCRA